MHKSRFQIDRMMGLRIQVTRRCNFSCVYCHQEGAKSSERGIGEPDIDQILNGVDRITKVTDGAVKYIGLTGGNPTLRQDLPLIVQKLKERYGTFVSVTDNGTFDESMCLMLGEHLDALHVTLPSVNRTRFESLTGCSGDVLERVKQGLKAAVKILGETRVLVNLSVVSGEGNEIADVMDVLDYSESLGIREVKIGNVVPRNVEELKNGAACQRGSLEGYGLLESLGARRYHRKRLKVNLLKPRLRPFCDRCCLVETCLGYGEQCTDMRLDASGVMRPCLYTALNPRTPLWDVRTERMARLEQEYDNFITAPHLFFANGGGLSQQEKA